MGRKTAFTLAEVLITLGIIGIVASMTLPALINKYKKQETIAAVQKTYSVLNQAFRMTQAKNESYKYWEDGSKMEPGEYFNKYWKPYFKISRVCNTYQECGYSRLQPWLQLDGSYSGINVVNTQLRSTFYTPDGVLIGISSLVGDSTGTNYLKDKSIYIDINGPKRPNRYGKDMFVFTRTEKGIMPVCYNSDDTDIDEDCSKNGSGYCCAAKLSKDGWQMKEDYPW